ncbi:MAG: peroxiredoxin [Gemmatimonadota bacterium]|jgi:peroxiredoxin Q/BCP|uniref:peroxiredoxin n=1 Tax=Gemmatimonas sp. TaxID=1962908 RepID=UPI00391F471A|nr:redoxin domain-containing protein [Gemmatimonadota bacterium]
MRALFVLAATALPLAAQTPPKVGDKAPDFTIGTVTADNATPTPVSLASLKGKTVVIAFFPRARTSGCTVQLQTYRDRYATMFNGGKDVVLLAISTDAPADLHAWAREAKFPFLLGSDADGAVGTLFGAYMPQNRMDNRILAVVAPDGTIRHEARPFRAMGQDDYVALEAAVDRVSSGKP